jgi:hypothetical protein
MPVIERHARCSGRRYSVVTPVIFVFAERHNLRDILTARSELLRMANQIKNAWHACVNNNRAVNTGHRCSRQLREK